MGGKGGAFLQAPRSESHILEDCDFECAVRLRLHADLLPAGQPCPFVGRTSESGAACQCPFKLDCKGTHTTSCARGGGLVRRHDVVAKVGIGAGLKDLDCEAVLCEQHSSPDQSGFAPKVDIAAIAPDGRQLQFDVVVAHPASVRALEKHSYRIDGVAASDAEDGKWVHYGDRNVTPAAFETGGRPGEALIALVRTLLPEEPARRSFAAQMFWQRVSVVLQRENARAIQLAQRRIAK